MVREKDKQSYRKILRRKLFRDMRKSTMQFLAMMLLCALGTWVYSGLDANWRLMDRTMETYYSDGNLADMWVKGAGFTKQEVEKIRHVQGVKTAQSRTSLEVDVEDLGDEVTVMLHAYDGTKQINVPEIRSGSDLQENDRRGILVEEQFAQAHNLAAGDEIKLKIAGTEQKFQISGLVMSCEYSVTSKQTTPDPEHYGFVIVTTAAVPMLPINDVLVDIDEGAEVSDVQAEIAELLPSALILTQKTHGPTATSRNYTSTFHAMCYIFPILVYAVAALVVMSTLTRMMETQRTQMGTLKALGYRDKQIRNHYLMYALVPSAFGSAIGLFVGQWTLPYILWPIVASNMRFPRVLHAPISISVWVMAVMEVVMVLFICFHTYKKAAAESTADLLRPKPPKSGTRILLEKVDFMWKRFSFNTKMVVRNLFRNKGRTFMSLVGIICCNMLIVCTFGLSDSMKYFVGQYFDTTIAYDVRCDLSADEVSTLSNYRETLDAEKIDGIMEKTVSIHGRENDRSCVLTVFAQGQTSMNLGKNGTFMQLPDEGIAISAKLAQVMGISMGDTVNLWIAGETEPATVQVAALAHTNINQGLFMSQKAWESCRKGDFAVTSLLITSPEESCLHKLDEMDEKERLLYPPDQYDQTMQIMDSISIAFTVMSIAALALAFIICYNMGLMNFTERTRDYATLKVLGYHQKEIRGLMMQENNLTAIIGVILGAYPGVLLTKVIFKMCEFESMVFVVHVTFVSIIVGSLITYAFTFFIQWLLTRKVKGIDMVEALKSVE